MPVRDAQINKASGNYGVLPAQQHIALRATVTLTSAAYANRVLLMDASGAALTFTLPAAVGSMDRYYFMVRVVNTSNYIVNVTGNDTIDGSILSLQDSADTVVGWETAAASDTITLNGTTQGGVSIGDWFEVLDIDVDQWAVTGVTTSSGTEATPFSEAV